VPNKTIKRYFWNEILVSPHPMSRKRNGTIKSLMAKIHQKLAVAIFSSKFFIFPWSLLSTNPRPNFRLS
jgi:hypothetical protein